MFFPMELHIGPFPQFFLLSIVCAHPSTAMSYVAIRKYIVKKKKNVTPWKFIDPALSVPLLPMASVMGRRHVCHYHNAIGGGQCNACVVRRKGSNHLHLLLYEEEGACTQSH